MQQEFGIRDIYFLVIVHLRGMWRHRWHLVFVAWFICLSGWGAVSVMDDHYQASATVKINDPRMEIARYLDSDASGVDVTREARRVLNDLMSRANLLKVIAETDLAFQVNDEFQKEETLSTLRAQLELKHIGNNVYRISHRYNKPMLTLQVVRALLKILPLDTMHSVSGGQARTAQEFLGQQIQDYEQEVVEAERKLREFTSKNLLLLPGKEGGYYERVRKLVETIGADRTRLRQLEEQRQEMQRQLDVLKGHVESPTEAVDKRIAELEKMIEDLFSRVYIKGGQKRSLYTESHAEVVALRASIAALNKRKEEIVRGMKEGADNPDLWELESNPVFRQLRLSISELDVELAALRGRVDESEERLRRLKEQENILPAIENEHLRLKSYLEMTKNTMRAMLDNQGKARFTGDVEERLSRFVRFKVMEYPTLPTAPFGPNRPLFQTVVLISGVLAGVAVSLFFAVMRPVFDSPAALKKVLGLPVLGMVSMVEEGGSGRWMNSNWLYLFSLLGLLGLYLAVMKGIPGL